VRKQGGEVLDLVQKTFRDFTTDIDESHSQSGRASLAYDLLLAVLSKEITRKIRVYTQGLSPTNTHKNSGTVPEFSRIHTQGLSLIFTHTNLGTVPELSASGALRLRTSFDE
jgi:hypothetical protein